MPSLSTARRTGRFHPRIFADLTVRVLVDGKEVPVKAKDVSMAGMSLLGLKRFERSRLTLSIPLPGHKLITSATVKRRSTEGVAIEFDQLDWDDLLALARYLHPRLP